MTEIDRRAAERMPIRRMLTLADYMSLSNAALGLLAIIAAFNGRVDLVFGFLLFAILFDGCDGAMSRLGYGGGVLGGKMDTLSDMVSFVVAPALLFWTVYGRSFALPGLPEPFDAYAGGFVILAVSATYFATGLLRLARFDYLKGGDQHDYFIGVTTPGAAAVIASVAAIGWQPLPALLVMAALSFLMTSRVRLPKARGSLAPAAGFVLLAAAILGIAGLDFGPMLLLVAFLCYLIFGSMFVRRHQDESDEDPQPLV